MDNWEHTTFEHKTSENTTYTASRCPSCKIPSSTKDLRKIFGIPTALPNQSRSHIMGLRVRIPDAGNVHSPAEIYLYPEVEGNTRSKVLAIQMTGSPSTQPVGKLKEVYTRQFHVRKQAVAFDGEAREFFLIPPVLVLSHFRIAVQVVKSICRCWLGRRSFVWLYGMETSWKPFRLCQYKDL